MEEAKQLLAAAIRFPSKAPMEKLESLLKAHPDLITETIMDEWPLEFVKAYFPVESNPHMQPLVDLLEKTKKSLGGMYDKIRSEWEQEQKQSETNANTSSPQNR